VQKLYTPSEVAEIIKIHPDTVRIWLRTKRLKGFRTRAGWRVQESDLQAWAAEQRGYEGAPTV
jgi:excisionase family DNA binding protein